MIEPGCVRCAEAPPLDLAFTFAFQPIVVWSERRVFAWEALIRGLDGAGAATILSRVTPQMRYALDQRARAEAIALAASLFADDGALLSINTMPNAIYDPRRCLATTLRAAKANAFPPERLMFEMTEDEEVLDMAHLKRIVSHYGACGFTTAIDDFGKRFANLDFLVHFKPHILKLDRALIEGVERDPMRRALLRGMLAIADEVGIRIVAEGVETVEELAALLAIGFDVFQGFLFARPGLRSLPPVDWDGIAARLAGAARDDRTLRVTPVPAVAAGAG